MDIILTGFMGTGKTTVGQLLAQKLSLPIWDLDQRIEQASGQSVNTIFAVEGEAYFRKLEQQALAQVLTQPGVLALGGGTLENIDNVRVLKHSPATIVWLDAQVPIIWQRIKTDSSRPLAQNMQQLCQLKAKRQASYQQVADIVVQTDTLLPTQVMAQILMQVQDL